MQVFFEIGHDRNIPDRNMNVKNNYSGRELDSCATACETDRMKQIQNLRKLKGWNQTMLAEVAGIEQSTVSKVENGWDGITLRNLKKIADALEIEPYQLFIDDGSIEELSIIEAYRALSEDRRKGWLDMAVLAKADVLKEDQ